MTGWLFVPIHQLLNYVCIFFAGKDGIIERLWRSARTRPYLLEWKTTLNLS